MIPRFLILSALAALAVPAFGQVSVLDTECLRLQAGKALAAGKITRMWHFEKFKEPMQDWPREVKGTFVEVRCEDSQFSESVLILVRDDFRLRSYPTAALVAEDRALANKLEAERKITVKPPDKKSYIPDFTPYTRANANIVESDHFAFYYGNTPTGPGKTVFEDKDFLPRQERWFEKVWNHLGVLGAPLPMVGDASPHKINVYITGTGLAQHKDGFAFGGDSVTMSPSALGPGSSVVIHEFTHSVQFYSKGFRDSPYVGWFWECHANWSTHQFMPAYPPELAHYAGRAHYELNSSRHNYGSWPFLQTLAENPRFGFSFPYDIWPACQRNESDAALEDPFQTIMRLGTERGIWKDGLAGFGDVIGELAARMVAWDFQNQFFQQREIRDLERNEPGVLTHRVELEPVADRAGYWKPIYSHAPRQFGVNLIDLETGAKPVEVMFAGIVDETEGSDWRVTLVAHDALGHCRYSPTVHGGKLALDVRDGEKITLAIAATPAIYKQLDFRPGFNKKRRYPYEVAFQGATPAGTPLLRGDEETAGAPHPNGGGFVAAGAKVAATAYVGPNARVLEAATVSGNARIEDFAIVRQDAQVTDHAIVGGFARITDRAKVRGNARVRGFARLGGEGTINGNARLLEYATVDGHGTISGDVLVKGFGEIHLQPATELTGGTICGEDLEVHFQGSKLERLSGGMIYGYMDSELMKEELGGGKSNNHWLYAHWTFDEPRQQVLKDANADCDGVLRGTPRFGSDRERKYLAFDGKSHALVEGHVADTRDITMDLQLSWDGGAGGQRIFEFGGPDAGMVLAITEGGRPAFAIQRGNETAIVRSSAPLVPGKWTRVTITLKDHVARLFLDGKTVGGNDHFALAPEDVAARSGRIGAGLAGIGFAGKLDDFAVYRTGFPTPGEIPSPTSR